MSHNTYQLIVLQQIFNNEFSDFVPKWICMYLIPINNKNKLKKNFYHFSLLVHRVNVWHLALFILGILYPCRNMSSQRHPKYCMLYQLGWTKRKLIVRLQISTEYLQFFASFWYLRWLLWTNTVVWCTVKTLSINYVSLPWTPQIQLLNYILLKWHRNNIQPIHSETGNCHIVDW